MNDLTTLLEPGQWSLVIHGIHMQVLTCIAEDQSKESHFQPQGLHCRAVGEPCSCLPDPSFLFTDLINGLQFMLPGSKDVQICLSKQFQQFSFIHENLEKFSWKCGLHCILVLVWRRVGIYLIIFYFFLKVFGFLPESF